MDMARLVNRVDQGQQVGSRLGGMSMAVESVLQKSLRARSVCGWDGGSQKFQRLKRLSLPVSVCRKRTSATRVSACFVCPSPSLAGARAPPSNTLHGLPQSLLLLSRPPHPHLAVMPSLCTTRSLFIDMTQNIHNSILAHLYSPSPSCSDTINSH